MGITQQQVLAHVTQHGPIVAAKIASDLGTDSFLVGAYLSELLESKQLHLTKSSAAGAPLYYISSQHADIVVLRDKLKEKDQRTFDLLKEKSVLREDELEPLTRVSLKNLPDFAHSLKIKMGSQTVVFWKWFLVTNDEVVGILQQKYESQKPAPPQENTKQVAPTQQSLEPTPVSAGPAVSGNILDELRGSTNTGDVISRIENANIRISSSIDLKKNKESDCIMHVPTAFGLQQYFVKILFKKKITETDLSSLFMQGSLKHLPICLITNGVLTKKAEVLHDGDLSSVMIVNLLM